MKLFLLLFLFVFEIVSTNAQKQIQKNTIACDFNKTLLGKWTIENMVADLSGENLETEGQSWKISATDNADIKDKITMTFSPDGTFTGTTTANDSTQISYGYWTASKDCKSLLIEVDDILEELAIFSIEKQYLVLKMENEYKMIFRKFNR